MKFTTTLHPPAGEPEHIIGSSSCTVNVLEAAVDPVNVCVPGRMFTLGGTAATTINEAAA